MLPDTAALMGHQFVEEDVRLVGAAALLPILVSERVCACRHLHPVSALDTLVDHEAQHKRHIALVGLPLNQPNGRYGDALVEVALQTWHQARHRNVHFDKVARLPEMVPQNALQSRHLVNPQHAVIELLLVAPGSALDLCDELVVNEEREGLVLLAISVLITVMIESVLYSLFYPVLSGAVLWPGHSDWSREAMLRRSTM